MDKRKRTMILLPILFTAAFLLTLHPDGVLMRFAEQAGAQTYFSYPHYSMIPVGYGNWGPMITFLSTAAAAIFSFVLLLTKKEKYFIWVRNCGIAAIVGSVISLMLFGTMTVFGMAILVFAAVAMAFAHEAAKD